MTRDLRWADAPGNVGLISRVAGLPQDSVANVSRMVAIDKSTLVDRAGKLPQATLELLLAGIDIFLGRSSLRVQQMTKST